MKEKPNSPNNLYRFPTEEFEKRAQRDSYAARLLRKWRTSEQSNSVLRKYDDHLPHYTMQALEVLLDQKLQHPGTVNDDHITAIAEEYLRRRDLLPAVSEQATAESAGYHRKGKPNVELEKGSETEMLQNDLSDLHGEILKAFSDLKKHVKANPELGIRNAEVDDKMEKYLLTFERDGMKSLRNELVFALENNERGTWGDREAIEKYLGLFHAYLSMTGGDGDGE